MSYLACYDRFENMKACFYQKASEASDPIVSFSNDRDNNREFAVDTETAEFRRPSQEHFRAPTSPQLPQNPLFAVQNLLARTFGQ